MCWIVDAITLCYSSMGLDCTIGVRAHSTRGMASSWAWSSGVFIKDICEALAGPRCPRLTGSITWMFRHCTLGSFQHDLTASMVVLLFHGSQLCLSMCNHEGMVAFACLLIPWAPLVPKIGSVDLSLHVCFQIICTSSSM